MPMANTQKHAPGMSKTEKHLLRHEHEVEDDRNADESDDETDSDDDREARQRRADRRSKESRRKLEEDEVSYHFSTSHVTLACYLVIGGIQKREGKEEWHAKHRLS